MTSTQREASDLGSPVDGAGLLLLHGGEHGSWCWDRVRPLLQYPSLAIDMPGRGSQDPIRRTVSGHDFLETACAALDRTGWQRVIVVAHSLGGLVACRLAEAREEIVEHIVGLSAIVPPYGKRPIDLVPRLLRPGLEVGFRAVLWRTGTYGLPLPVAGWLFCNGMSDTERRETLSQLCRETGAIWFEPFDVQVPAHIGRSWIHLLRDRAVSRRLRVRIMEHLGATQSYSIDSGHDVMISRPLELATILNHVAVDAFRATRT